MINQQYQIIYGNQILATGDTKGVCINQLAYSPCPTTIEIKQRGESQYVIVCNNLWRNKRVELPTSYSLAYTRHEILNDIASKVCKMNGYSLQRAIY